MAQKAPKDLTQLLLIDRVNLLAILPSKGGFAQLTTIRSIVDKLKVTQDEIKRYEIKDRLKEDGGGVKWNKKGSTEKKGFAFDELEKLEIKLALEAKSKEKEITMEYYGLCVMFDVKE